jgi:hypothetical protein
MATKTSNARTLQASASNAAAATTTGTALDLTTALGLAGTARITNGATGPTVGCDFVLEVSNDNSDWHEWSRQTAGTTSSGVYYFPFDLPPPIRYARSKFTGNTVQAVTVECDGHELSSIG